MNEKQKSELLKLKKIILNENPSYKLICELSNWLTSLLKNCIDYHAQDLFDYVIAGQLGNEFIVKLNIEE